MGSKILTFGAGQFDAGTVIPGPLADPQSITEATGTPLADPRMDFLGQCLTSGLFSKPEKLRIQEWISDRFELNGEIDSFIETFRLRSRAKVEQEWEESKAAVLAQQEIISAFHKDLAKMQQNLNQLTDIKGKTFMGLTEAREERQALSRFAPRKQVEAADILVTQREKLAAEAELEAGAVQGQMNQKKFVLLPPLMEKLKKLAAEEMRLRHSVTGESFTDEYGLVHPARPR